MKITDLFKQLGLPYITEGPNTRPGWMQLRCPRCSGDPYLGINLNWNYANCWRCGKLSLSEVLRELTGQSWGQCKELLKGLSTGYALERPKRGLLRVPNGLGPLDTAHIRYLRQRGYNATELVRLWGLRGFGPTGRFKWRIFIPIHYRGEIVSWTTRSIGDGGGTRYLAAKPEDEAMDHRKLLFGGDYARYSTIVTEGPFDVFSIGCGATCTFGIAFSRAQVLEISKFPKRIICFDNEPEAQKRALQLCKLLSVFPGETLNVVLNVKDAGEAKETELKKLRSLL